MEAKKARSEKKHRFRDLYRMINGPMLNRREKRHCRVKEWFKDLKPKLQGCYNYYGVSGTYASLQRFFGEAMQILRKWLNRRSQRSSYSWEGFRALIEHFQVPRPRIRPRPRMRMAASAS